MTIADWSSYQASALSYQQALAPALSCRCWSLRLKADGLVGRFRSTLTYVLALTRAAAGEGRHTTLVHSRKEALRYNGKVTILRPIPHDIRLIVFDLDGTLIDSKEDLALSVNLMRAEMGLGPLEYDLIASYVGQGVGMLVRRALANGRPLRPGAKPESVPDEDVERGVEIFLRTYRLHMLDHTVTYPGVREALAELDDGKVPSLIPSPVCANSSPPRTLAVLTNKPVNFSRTILIGLGIASHFAVVYGGNSPELNQKKKPDPEGLFKLMGDAGATANQTLMVGDSDTDVLTGRNAGVWICGVTYGIGSHTLETTPPDVLVGDMRELAAFLGE